MVVFQNNNTYYYEHQIKHTTAYSINLDIDTVRFALDQFCIP